MILENFKGSITLVELIKHAACAFAMECGRSARKVHLPDWRKLEFHREIPKQYWLFDHHPKTGKLTIAGLEVVFWQKPWIELQ